MNQKIRFLAVTSIACLPLAAGCGPDNATGGTGGTGGAGDTGGGTTGVGINPGTGGSTSTGTTASGNYIRVHYRLQNGADTKGWGMHFWGAGSPEPKWGSPQLLDKKDDFGAYTDIAVTVTSNDKDKAWLGLIPVQCMGTDCKQDVQTSVRFADLSKDSKTPNIAECWITQGQTVLTSKPTSTGPAYKIGRPKDFIDLGDGRVRMMFRVAKGSTGTVQYGASKDALTNQVAWSANDDINTTGLILDKLTPGKTTYYKISTTLKTASGDLPDQTEVLDITPIAFSTIAQSADWASWGSKGVMYQLIVRTFADGGKPKTVTDTSKESGIDTSAKDGIGDLVGLKNTLPYLKDLGINAIWMTPVFAAKSYHGYDTTDFYAIDPAVGTKKDFADLAAAAHALGINLILDLVQNHVADVNPWFLAATNPQDKDYAKYHDWFTWADEYSNMTADKHPWDDKAVVWSCTNYMCYNEIFGSAMPELNYHNPAVRKEMKDISKFWIDLGADGFRLDASKHIDQFDDDHKTPLDKHGTHVWWKEFNYYVKKGVDRASTSLPVLLTGENRWDDPAVVSYMVPYAGDMDSQFDFPFRSMLGNFISGKTDDSADFVKYMKNTQTLMASTANGGNPNHFLERFLSNHDLERPATQFEGAGAALPALLKQAATVVFTVPGMPVVYYGEEFGKKGKRDKYVGNEPYDHDEFIREPMSWFSSISFKGDMKTSWNIDFEKTNLDNASLFLAAGICAAPNPDYPFIKFMSEKEESSFVAQKGVPGSLFEHYRKLIQIRKANAAITDLDTQLTTVQNTANIYEYSISKGLAKISVVLNRSASTQTVTRLIPAMDLLTGKTGLSFDIPAHGSLVLQ